MKRKLTPVILCFLLLCRTALAAPSNDECTNAEDLTEGVALFSTNVGATDSGVNHCAGDDTLDVWFFYRPDASKQINVSLCGSDFDTTVALYDGCGGVEVACNDMGTLCGAPEASYLECIPVVKNRDYFVRVAGNGGATGNISVLVEEAMCTYPGGDDCALAPQILVGTTVGGNMAGATDSGVLRCVGSDAVDVWYRYQPDVDGPVTFSLCGSDFDTTLSVFEGCTGARIDCNNDTALVCAEPTSSSIDCLTVSAGLEYYLRIAGVGDVVNNYALTITGCVPPNDDCANALPLTEAGAVQGNTSYATDSGAERCVVLDTGDVWYAYTAPATQSVEFIICDTDFDTTLSVFDACGGTLLSCNDDSLYCAEYLSRVACLPVEIGETYLVRVSGWDTQVGRFNLSVAPMTCTVPENDECTDAIPLTLGVTAYGDNTGATGTALSTCSAGDFYDIWYSYTPAANMVVNVSTCGSHLDTSLEIWDACGGGALDCNDDSGGAYCKRNAHVNDYVMSGGTTYLLRVAGYAGDRGEIAVTVSDATGPGAILITPDSVGPTNAGSVSFAVHFDEAVVNFDDASDVVITENAVTHAGVVVNGSGANYTVTVSGLEGEGTFTLAVSTASDVASVGLVPLAYSATSAAVAIDTVGPIATLSTPTDTPTNTGFGATIAFDEEPVGFEMGDLIPENATLDNLYGSGTTYHVEVVAVSEGPFGISLAPGTFADALGNLNTVAPSLGLVYDGTAPVISGLVAEPNVAEPGQVVHISFSTDESFEDVPMLAVNGHEAQPGAKAGYTFDYTVQQNDPSGPATITVIGFDAAGNVTFGEFAAALTIENVNYVPLAAWPVLIALGLAGTLVARRRRD